ncbi:hypothetical protein [Aquamicrobium sp. LC103]|uniref:hypothetical protein n=1 Tax=Aquamicrobium sp. LC103 TaxID=1120658 RepID=UPI00109CAD3F|nr:hypothetical protein [Aquamicrobium sp. LC103]TKT81361.1 hypothetical protein XW59_005735 [Aquamicrobium sp. LC103]
MIFNHDRENDAVRRSVNLVYLPFIRQMKPDCEPGEGARRAEFHCAGAARGIALLLPHHRQNETEKRDA